MDVISARGRAAHEFFSRTQAEICERIAELDGGPGFRTDRWTRADGGGGESRVLLEGPLIEKGGVNVSCVHGTLSESFAQEIPGEGRRFFATGISLVIHPRSPHVPTVHANFRYLEKGTEVERVGWFGGGADLTPWILYEEDAIHFHQSWRSVCDRHPHPQLGIEYVRLKEWCDRYFFLPHRGETRGIGGIFFDYLGLPQKDILPKPDLDVVEAFVRDAAGQFLAAYVPILERRRSMDVTDEQRDWQLRRRGRYVEFNLLYDRGTIFGLKTDGRVESILMSLPPLVRWNYGDAPRAGSYQQHLIDVLQSPKNWLG